MSRKYKQKGYMQDSSEDRKPRRPQSSGEGKVPLFPSFRQIFRCSMCGTATSAQMGIKVESQCTKCGADLHTCRNCSYFDTAHRFECTQPVLERISRKDLRNQCTYFEPRKIVERETSSVTSRAEDARKAFENLFKK